LRSASEVHERQNLNYFNRLIQLGTIKAKFAFAQKFRNNKKNFHIKKNKDKYEQTLPNFVKLFLISAGFPIKSIELVFGASEAENPH
jgi:hypothetical protein